MFGISTQSTGLALSKEKATSLVRLMAL